MKHNGDKMLLLCILSSLLLINCRTIKEGGSKKEIILTGRIQNVNQSSFQFTYDVYSLLEGTQKKNVEIDSNGNFKVVLNLNSPVQGTLYFGREMIKGRGVNKYIYTYLEPGDSVFISADVKVLADTNIIQKTLAISGTNPANSKFLNNFENNFNSYELLRQNNHQSIMMLNPNEYKWYVDSIRDKQIQYLKDFDDSLKLAKKLKEIAILEYENLAAARKINYPSGNKSFNNGNGFPLPDDYYNFMEQVKILPELENAGLPYLRFANFYLQNKYNLAVKNGIEKDYPSFIDGELKGRAKYILMAYSLSSDFNPEIYAKVKENPYKDIQDIVRKKYSHLERMLPGKPAPDVIFSNVQNESINSAYFFSGKYIYIDFWATWCKPCIREIPDLVRLKEEYKDKNIEFVSISVDANKEEWKNYVNKEMLTGIQFWVDEKNKSIYDKGFNITMIPRFVLIDDKGKIVNANAPRPSSGKEIRKLLDHSLDKDG